MIHKTVRPNHNARRMLGRACAMSLVLAALASCVRDNESQCPSQATDAGYRVDISLSAGYLNTRTSGHRTEAGTEAESFIDIAAKDFAVYILDGSGAYVQRFEPAAVTLQKAGTTDAGLYRYKISGAFLPDKTLKEVQFLVLANWQTAFGGNYYRAEQMLTTASTTLSAVYGDADNFNFTLPVPAAASSWQPEVAGSGGIPMFGLSETITLDEDNPVVEVRNEIPMLRALAKIEIVDKVPEGANIEKCVLTGYNRNGRFIPAVPANTAWSAWAAAIPTLSLPTAVSFAANLPFARTTKQVDMGGTEPETRPCFVAYVPEMDLQAADVRPVVQITINGIEYTVELSAYEEGKPKTEGGYDALLRNHNYCFNILSVGVDVDLTLYIETPEWTLDEDEYYYEDTAAKYAENGAFAWEWDDDNKDDDEFVPDGQEADRRVVVVSKEEGIEGIATFTLQEPARGTWTLSLSPDDGTPNHWFRIDLWDEESGSWIVPEANAEAAALTGKIAPKGETPRQVKIRIVAQDLQYSGAPYSARLLMSVTTFDGRMTEVNLTNEDPMAQTGDHDHYIIKQYPTSLE